MKERARASSLRRGEKRGMFEGKTEQIISKGEELGSRGKVEGLAKDGHLSNWGGKSKSEPRDTVKVKEG